MYVVSVDRRLSSSINTTLDGSFELNSQGLVLIFSAVVAFVLLVLFVGLPYRSHIQARLGSDVTQDEGRELEQKATGSPIQTGAPLNSHALPPNQQSDAENSDGADSDRF